MCIHLSCSITRLLSVCCFVEFTSKETYSSLEDSAKVLTPEGHCNLLLDIVNLKRTNNSEFSRDKVLILRIELEYIACHY